MGEPVGWMRSVVFDAVDKDALAAFWSAVLGTEVAEREDDWTQLTVDEGGCFLAFQPAPADTPADTPRIRARPDIEVTDPDAARAQVEALGGHLVRVVHEAKGDDHYVMADPEGNEFCLVLPLPPELRRPDR